VKQGLQRLGASSQLEETIRRQTNEIIDSVAEKGEADFVTEMSAELPLQ